ncbi:hypothetical protein BDV96DRAFT_693657 [Lophiotrema nucula]|uniref:Uncharacterized protein n=1 Tax=Lophiotrema nucula TaxID=690887 RepID=A0A6A5YKF3_9PLEO|nr:hypothetical protein BDV96DRAFT_693657 [Lophiotrema nucula]
MHFLTIVGAFAALATTAPVSAAPVADGTVTVRDPSPCNWDASWNTTCNGRVASTNETIHLITSLCNATHILDCEPGNHVPSTRDSYYTFGDLKASIRLGEQCGTGDKWDSGYCFRLFNVINAACGKGIPDTWSLGTAESGCDGTRVKVEYEWEPSH